MGQRFACKVRFSGQRFAWMVRKTVNTDVSWLRILENGTLHGCTYWGVGCFELTLFLQFALKWGDLGA